MYELQHEYSHAGMTWHLGSDQGRLILKTPHMQLQIPMFETREHSEELLEGRISQVYQCEDGWCLKIFVSHHARLQVFHLEFSKEAILLSFPNTPPGLCVDLLELLAARSIQAA